MLKDLTKRKDESSKKSGKRKNKKVSFKKLKSYFIMTVVITIILAVGIFVLKGYNADYKADTDYMYSLIKESSELTTAKLSYTGMTEFKDKGVTFLNRSDFTMAYEATLRAGIDVKDVNVTADDENKIIYISIPEATILDVKVKPSSIKYYAEKISLFNTDEKEDANKAQELAEQAALKEAKGMGVLELANQQAETLIKGILVNAIPDGYTIAVK